MTPAGALSVPSTLTYPAATVEGGATGIKTSGVAFSVIEAPGIRLDVGAFADGNRGVRGEGDTGRFTFELRLEEGARERVDVGAAGSIVALLNIGARQYLLRREQLRAVADRQVGR